MCTRVGADDAHFPVRERERWLVLIPALRQIIQSNLWTSFIVFQFNQTFHLPGKWKHSHLIETLDLRIVWGCVKNGWKMHTCCPYFLLYGLVALVLGGALKKVFFFNCLHKNFLEIENWLTISAMSSKHKFHPSVFFFVEKIFLCFSSR